MILIVIITILTNPMIAYLIKTQTYFVQWNCLVARSTSKQAVYVWREQFSPLYGVLKTCTQLLAFSCKASASPFIHILPRTAINLKI